MQILPIASGKGGVGKSLLAANLAIVLSRAGKDVVLADLDFGGSNLHLILGVRGVSAGVGAVVNNPDVDFADVVLETEYENLRFIPGDGEIPGIANLGAGQKRKLIRRLRSLEADYLVLDLGAGTSYNVMDFFLLSRQGIVVTTPTPTALVNAYLCIKNALFRLLNTSFKRGSDADQALKQITKDTEHLQRVYLPDLVSRLEKFDPESVARYRTTAGMFRPRLVLNMLDDPKDADKVTRLRHSCSQYLGLELEHLGVMYRDDLQDISLGARLPIVLYKPNSVLSQAIFRIGDKIMELASEDEEGWFSSDESFEVAEAEAEADFEIKSDYVNELLHTGALSHGDLLETVKSQQIEINQLRKQNDLLKAKLVKAANQGFDVR
ncbi:MAG: P-loop NTPase [Spirochaetota bacterium]